MARAAKDVKNLQVFRGSKSVPDVFSSNRGDCCTPNSVPTYDKLGNRTRFDNSLAHSNPTGANDKFEFPGGNGFSGISKEIIDWINANGVGTTISVLVLPTYGRLTDVAVHIGAEEAGMTFNLIARNGTVIPVTATDMVTADLGANCAVTRVHTSPGAGIFTGFGALGGHDFIDLFGAAGNGNFILEADELMLQVATMPTNGVFTGAAQLTVAASYRAPLRAEA